MLQILLFALMTVSASAGAVGVQKDTTIPTAPSDSHANPRISVNFDFAWRYMRGVDPRYKQCTYEQGRNYGQGNIWSGELLALSFSPVLDASIISVVPP